MLFVAAILLTLGGAGGLFLAILRFRGGNPPLPLAYVHGSAAAAGVIAVIAATILQPEPLLIAAIVSAAIGAPFGVLMLLAHRRQKLIPISMLIPHALLEVTAILLTWVAAVSKMS